jgi:hypothetical protein
MSAPAVPPAENGAPYYSAAFALFVDAEDDDLDWKPVKDGTPEVRARLKAWIARNREALEMLARARQRPRCRFDHDYRQGFQMLLPELAPMMKVSRLLQMRAELQAIEGDGAGARETVRSSFALADCGKDEPLLIFQLVRAVLFNRAAETVGACITSETTAADLQEWRALVPAPEEPFKGCLERCLRGELAIVAETLSRPLEEFPGLAEPKLNGPWAWLLRPWLMSDGARYVGVMRRSAEASRNAYPQARIEFDALDKDQESRRSWARPISGALLPALGRGLDSLTAAPARLATLCAGLEAELEHRRTGKVPSSVVRTDPFTGKPLTYDPKAGRISSVGASTNPEPIEWVLRGKRE